MPISICPWWTPQVMCSSPAPLLKHTTNAARTLLLQAFDNDNSDDLTCLLFKHPTDTARVDAAPSDI